MEARNRPVTRARAFGFAALLAVAGGIALLAPSAGSAANPSCTVSATSGTQTTYECNVSTGTIGGYEVRQWYDLVPNPLPSGSGFITHMETDIVDSTTGAQVPIQRLMLHHIVFTDINQRDSTCQH